MVPVAAAVGLSLTPSRYIAARAAGGVVLAIAANVARQAAVATRKKLAPEAMLELLRREGASSVTREQVRLPVGCVCVSCAVISLELSPPPPPHAGVGLQFSVSPRQELCFHSAETGDWCWELSKAYHAYI